MKKGKILLFVLGIAFAFVSCTKVSEEVVGTWNFQTFDNSPQGTMTWTFEEDGQLIRVLTTESGIKFDSCNYVVDKSLLKTQISISGSKMMPGFDALDGVYRIDKMKGDLLIMTRIKTSDDEVEGSYLRCELQRKL